MPRKILNSTILRLAKLSISDRRNWVQGSYRRGKKACAVGAVQRLIGIKRFVASSTGPYGLPEKLWCFLEKAAKEIGESIPQYVNDRSQILTPNGWVKHSSKDAHRDVMKMFDIAIKAAKECEAQDKEKSDA